MSVESKEASGSAENVTDEEFRQIDPYLLRTISDEYLRKRISQFIGEPTPKSWWKRTSTHPLTITLVGFFLTSIIGFFLTYYYNNKQKEIDRSMTERQNSLARERSFADEINKIRVGKIGEVWEKVDLYEASVRPIMKKTSLLPDGIIKIEGDAKKDFEELYKKFEDAEELNAQLSSILERNRFWLGKRLYKEIKKYARTSYQYFFKLKSLENVHELKRERRLSRTELNQIRDKMLKGEL